MKKWNYDKGILQVSATLFHHYGMENHYEDDPVVKKWLEAHDFRCVIALLIDGMGSEILKQHLPENSFLLLHQKESISTVYPPTTVAATTSFMTGLSPKETGWLGWTQYFKELEDTLILFYGKGDYSGIPYPNYAYDTLPIDKIFDVLNAHGIKADSVWPSFGERNACYSYEEVLDTLNQLVEDKELKFVYAYRDYFDSLMHKEGPSSLKTKEYLEEINQKTQEFVEHLPNDVGLLILADHGQIDVGERINLMEDIELQKFLKYPPCLETRTTVFYVKEDKEEAFQAYFEKQYGDHFALLTKKEIIESDLFGKGIAHPRFEEFIGDFISISKDDSQMYYGPRREKGNHAGPSVAEEMIPIILYPENHDEKD